MFRVDTSDFDAGVERVEDKLDQLAKIARDGSDLWPKVGEVFAEQQERLFDSGSLWQALDADTVRIKGDSRVLIESGSLMESATSPIPVESNPLYAKFGVQHGAVPYAHWHARGAGVPRRPPVPPISAELRRAWIEVARERLNRELNA